MTASARPLPSASLLEYFTLARASVEGIKLGADRRKDIADALAVGRQRSEAAETLWSNGHVAEGLRLAFASLEDTVAAAALLAEPVPETSGVVPLDLSEPEAPPEDPAGAVEAGSQPTPEEAGTEVPGVSEPARPSVEPAPALAPPTDRWRSALLARGVRSARADRVAQALAAVSDAQLPKLDQDLSPAMTELFPRVMAARQIVDGAIAPSAWSLAEIRWTRIRRTSSVVLGVVAVCVALYLGLHDPEGTFVSASEVWAQSPSFSADMATDGRPDTAWLLPDRTTGWLEVRTRPARRVESVVLTNTANAPSHDRGTQDYRLEIYAHGELARSIDGHFDWSDTPTPATHEIGMSGVERVRFVVRSFHRTGGGLAEMDIR